MEQDKSTKDPLRLKLFCLSLKLDSVLSHVKALKYSYHQTGAQTIQMLIIIWRIQMRLLSQVFANFSQFPSSEDLVHWDTRKKTEEKVIYLLGGVSLTNACLECRDVVMLWDVLFNMWFHCIQIFLFRRYCRRHISFWNYCSRSLQWTKMIFFTISHACFK